MSSGGFPLGLASLQRDAASGRKLPPVEKWNPAHCGDIDIRIARAVFYQLADLGVPGEDEHTGYLGVWSGGQFFRLGRPA